MTATAESKIVSLVDYSLDEDVCTLMDLSESYLQQQQVLGKCLSNAFMNIALARRGKAFLAAPEDIRCDINANAVIDDSNEEMKVEIGDANPMLMICAMPPPTLKSAQREILNALQCIVKMNQHRIALMKCCEDVEVYCDKRDADNCPFTTFVSNQQQLARTSIPLTIAEEEEYKTHSTTRPNDLSATTSSTSSGLRRRNIDVFDKLTSIVPQSKDIDSSSDSDCD